MDFLETEVIVTCHPMPLTPTTPTIPATNTPHTQNVRFSCKRLYAFSGVREEYHKTIVN